MNSDFIEYPTHLTNLHMSNLRTISPKSPKTLALQKERQSVRRKDDLDRVRNLEREIVRVDEEIDQ